MVSRVGSNQFTRRLKLRADRLEKNMGSVVKTAATAALEVLVFGTRVDTGVARSNWIVTRDSPRAGSISAFTPYPRGSRAQGLGITERANAAAALAAGYAQIEEFQMGRDADLFITNNVRYLRYIPEMGALTTEAASAASAAIRGIRLLT